VKVSLIQMSSQPDRAFNLAQAETMMREAVVTQAPDLIVLPEHFDWTGGTAEEKRNAADDVPGGGAYEMVRSFAKRYRVAVHAGSLLERSDDGVRVFNTSVVFDRAGREIGKYRKLHLFDITAPDGKAYRESATVSPGDGLFIYQYGGLRIACAICYDLRFSGLFDRLSTLGVDVFILPAAFTRQTGKDHWEVLCRARAIEFQVFVLACGQCGSYTAPGGELRQMHGHSLVCDPWGRIIAEAGDNIGMVSAELDTASISHVRRLIPMAAHRRDVRSVPLQTASADP
jgi:deaminated glutathione amidase